MCMLRVTFAVFLHSVDCNPPSLPSNGIIYPYTSTIEGAVVNFVCQKSALDLEENVSMAVCNEHGNWDPDPAEFCTRLSASGNISFV